MAVTSYYSVDGTILGEETGGTRRDYLTDALGNVTGTVTAAGAVENTYRYTPYGEQLSKTGAGSDPRFLWVGARGYRSNQNNYYIRARHYTQKYAVWSSQDPLGYVSGTNLFDYSYRNPSTLTDPSGKRPLLMIVLKKPEGKGCGEFEFIIKWLGLTYETGAVIQHVYRQTNAYECDPDQCNPKCNRNKPKTNLDWRANVEYYEAWNIKAGLFHDKTGTRVAPYDRFSGLPIGDTCGDVAMVGFAKFVPLYKIKIPPWQINYPPSGDLPALLPPDTPKENWQDWSDPDILKHWLTAEWDCCVRPKQETKITGHNP